MRIATTILTITAMAFPAAAQSDDKAYTLYRNSALDLTMHLHVATFDSIDGKDYNAENCFVAAELFAGQDGVPTRFWCEPGRYRK